MSSEGLSEDPKVYRERLNEQPDEQLDAWMIEFMRDMSIRRGVLPVLVDFRQATGLDWIANDHGFAVIYPEASDGFFPIPCPGCPWVCSQRR